MAESFADSFAKGADSLLSQQDKKLASRKEFPATLPEPLIEETPLLYRKGKRRAMTGLEIADEKEKDASRQRRRDAPHQRDVSSDGLDRPLLCRSYPNDGRLWWFDCRGECAHSVHS